MNNRNPQAFPPAPPAQGYAGPGPGGWGEEEEDQQAQLYNPQQQQQQQQPQPGQWGGPISCPPGMMPFSQLPPAYQTGILNGQYGAPLQNSLNRRSYIGYPNMQGQGQGQGQDDYNCNPNYDQGPSGMMCQPGGGQSQYQMNQGGCENQDASSLVGFQAVKLIRKIWGTPCKKGGQLLACRPTCNGKAICKPVSCVVTTKCPRKRCIPVCPQPSCRMQMQGSCGASCPAAPYPTCSCTMPRRKCQYRVSSQPRRMLLMRASDGSGGGCPQSQQEPIIVTMREYNEDGQVPPQTQAACATQATTCCEQQAQCSESKSYADTGVGCSQDERYMSGTRSSGAFNFRGYSMERYDRYDDNCCDDYDYDYGRGGGGGARGGRSGSCDSCESFERWREKCECRKKIKEECEKKATKDGQNDPKPIDQGTSSDEKLGKKDNSVSVNTSETKANKKAKKSKSAGSVKGKKGKGKGKSKGGKGKKGKGKKKKK